MKLPPSWKTQLTVLVAAGALLAFAACGNDDDGANGNGGAGGETTVGVELSEWSVTPDDTSVPAGTVTFEVENVGEETHEFVVIGTDLDVLELPTEKDGSVAEEGELEVVDELEDIASGDTVELTVDLDAGHYVLICNILEEEHGEHESHYQMGMRTNFTVE
jgi:uncharacterized cupredoxin-like copper-binding protein